MILVGAGKTKEGASISGSWFFWLTIILQFIFMVVVCVVFMFEVENLLTMGRDAWPVLEIGYSGAFFCATVIDMFIVGSWNKSGVDGTFLAAALFLLLLALLHGFAGFMMFRIWRGFVRSGASQNPTTPNIQPGDVGNMHPGV
ncbi:unnamed protein product [Bursaphelenchus xylophilus]|uniref:(pine wood nematode) hypothetical protein n=1 Tax=Bursaphelenchus xylophilus TaxID=6326 RepID=A0A1I7SVP8_BURXY|nr:unnamed protein product [Bursaphelenchus xylophilus]CAG9098052.1 unnamed protein product [Bursaphelenchus xylophilus]